MLSACDMIAVALSLIDRAIEIAGSEAKLGAATGYSQVGINKAKRRVAAGGQVSPEMAKAIDVATRGAVRKEDLRPDIFTPPATAADPIARCSHCGADTAGKTDCADDQCPLPLPSRAAA